jgi:hypothetical protein
VLAGVTTLILGGYRLFFWPADVDDDTDMALVCDVATLLSNIVLPGWVLLFPFFADLALGIMAHNLVGTPSGDNVALFWSYILVKRLSMISF